MLDMCLGEDVMGEVCPMGQICVQGMLFNREQGWEVCLTE
jgi:hypothetical protein